MREVFGIIPARYASTRFPGKPLVDLAGKPLIQHVYERVMATGLTGVAVATDDTRISDCVKSFGGVAVMTSPLHQSGTDRCCEAAQFFNPKDEDIIINIQGDEPLISSKEINLLKDAFNDNSVEIATLACPFTDTDTLNNPNAVKLVTNKYGDAMYFSRAPIPFLRQNSTATPHYLKHIGIYAYTFKTLQTITKLELSNLELTEKLEQLRWLENGFKIRVGECDYSGVGIDTPEDLKFVIDNLL